MHGCNWWMFASNRPGDPVRFSFEITWPKLKIWWNQVRHGECKKGSTCEWLHPEDDALKKIQESLRLVGNRVAKSPAFFGPPSTPNSVFVRCSLPCSKKNGRSYYGICNFDFRSLQDLEAATASVAYQNWKIATFVEQRSTLRSQKPCSKNRVRSQMALVAVFSRTSGSTKILLSTLEGVWMHMRSVDGWFPWNSKLLFGQEKCLAGRYHDAECAGLVRQVAFCDISDQHFIWKRRGKALQMSTVNAFSNI